MDYKQYLDKARGNLPALGLGLLGLILLSYGLIQLLVSNSQSEKAEDITFESANEESSKIEILVDVGGAVVAPGVYKLSADARIKDALVAASGLSSNADREWISKNLNQAAKLTDGAKIYIPRQGEQVQGSSQGVVSISGLININSASQGELESLAGIGPVTAGKIIDNRPYSSIEELRSKKVVGQSVFEKIKDKISIY